MASEAAVAWSSRAPGRVNLIGEHVDYLGGRVLPVAIDRFVSLRGRPAVKWELESDVSGGAAYLEAAGRELGSGPQHVEVSSDLPSGAGLSSSAAILVAIARGLRPDLDGREAALLSQRAEQAATGVQVGVMDHFASALGRAGHALLLDCSTLEYRHIPFPPRLVIAVIDSGIRRELSKTPYNRRRREAEAGEPRRLRHVRGELARVDRFAADLEAGRLESLGRLLKESHTSLRDDFEISTPAVDEIVERAWSAPGCMGARLMGAGFGGSILALLERGSERAFEAALKRPVLICRTADGAYAA